jgi:hypothetical protein
MSEQSGPFGGMSAQEAGKKSAEKRRLERELLESNPQQRIVIALTERAIKGDPAAVRELRELKVLVPETPDSKSDQGLLDLLTRDQRLCIQLSLKGEKVPRELALDAWVR